ncbi:mce related protein [Verrucomicrobiia bacterium DG1235]|nr:mce related protein [Verrucomicrobiae bacterium DG1235]
MSEKAVVRKQRRVSSIWIIPGVALMLGGWMLFDAILRADPVVEIRFETAEGIEAGRTKVKTRNIEIGLVEEVRLSEDFSEVIVSARIDRESAGLLKEDTQFWVMRPRIGIGGISGVGTLLSGAFVVLEPGSASAKRREFKGLDAQPTTPASAEGVRLSVFSEDSGSVNLGDPILYRGRRVGQVDAAEFELENDRFRYDIFVKAPYDSLVTAPTRFWKASAIQLQADANGFAINADSLGSVLAGGIAFDLPGGARPGAVVGDGARFQLFGSKGDIDQFPHQYYAEYLLFFNDSVRGLKVGAPVEYRGIEVGHVEDVSFSYFKGREFFGADEVPVPALVRIYPGHFQLEDTEDGLARMRGLVTQHASKGLRAALQRGNLLTGNLFVSMDFFPESEAYVFGAGVDWGYEVFPTHSVGLEQIERRILGILDTVDRLPLEDLTSEVREAIAHARTMFDNSKGLIENLDTIFSSDETQALPEGLERTLAAVEAAMEGVAPDSGVYRELETSFRKLNAALSDLQRLAQKLERRPNAILFSQPAESDPEPKAKR